MPRVVVVAGATGALGARVARAAAARGWRVRCFVRNPDRLDPALRASVRLGDALDVDLAIDAMRGADAVFSAVGASALPALGRGWRGYGAVDVAANRALIAAARAAGVGRFVYVSVQHPPAMPRLAYVAAHERVVDELRASPLAWAVVRPTGFFSAVGAYLELARRGAIPEIGDGGARSNPIADDDLADVCVDALADGDPRLEIAAGGPDVLTRRAIGQLAFAALGAPPRFRHVPVGVARIGAALLRPFHPRLAQLTAFVAGLGAHDVVAPVRGRRRLADHFAAIAAAPAAAAA